MNTQYLVRWTEDHKQIVTAQSQEEAIMLVKEIHEDSIKPLTLLRCRGHGAEKARMGIHPDRVYEIRLAQNMSDTIGMRQGEVMGDIFKIIDESNIGGHGIEINWVNSEEPR